MNSMERRISKIEATAGTGDHTGMIEILNMYCRHILYDNHMNGTNFPVPSKWVSEESQEAKEYIKKIEKYRRRLKC